MALECEQYSIIATSSSAVIQYTTCPTPGVSSETIQITLLNSSPCNDATSFSGNVAYPATKPYNVGTSIGFTTLSYDARFVPDRFIAYYDDTIVLDTGYRSGSSAYNYGGISRADFNAALLGREDPLTGNIYPFPDASHEIDNYPIVNNPGTGSQNFYKYSATITDCIIKVYAPMSGTIWDCLLECPNKESAPVGGGTFATEVCALSTPTVISGTATITNLGVGPCGASLIMKDGDWAFANYSKIMVKGDWCNIESVKVKIDGDWVEIFN